MKAKKKTHRRQTSKSSKKTHKSVGQKSTLRVANSSSIHDVSSSKFLNSVPDKAHSPGHRKLNLQSQVDMQNFSPPKNPNQNNFFPRKILRAQRLEKQDVCF